MKKHYETHVEDTDKLISVAGPELDYKSWYEQYRKLMEEQAQRKYGLYTPTSEGDDDFPSIPGMIARYSALGLTNEHMKENPVWVDKTGNGHDLQMKNFAWKGMSGVGGYVTNKDIYEYDLDRYSYTFIENSTKVHDFYIVFELIGYDENFKDGFNLDVRSISQGLKYRKTYTKNGIYIFQYKDEEGLDDLFAIGYNGNGGARSNFTVKILPLYPGFILGDGVDDEAATENLDLEDTYTVYTPLILPKYGGVVSGKSSAKDFSLNTVVSSKSIGFDSANAWSGSIPVDLFEFALVVCKRDPKTMYVKDLITGKANQSNSKEFVPSPGKYFIWRNEGSSWCQVAIAGQIICNGHFSTDEEDAKVLAWHKKQYPWLFPDQAWTVVGKTNEDEDRATIANITGNGNNLVLSNFGFAEGSGYNEEGEYAGYLVTDGVDDKVQSSSFTMNEDWTIVGDWELLSNVQINCGIVKAQNVYLYNIANGLLISINNPRSLQSFGTKSLHAICSDGRLYDRNWVEYEYTVDQNFAIVESSLNIGFNLNNYTQIAFKNLGIYNNQILSKDDCIKAYNYLQTLKAK